MVVECRHGIPKDVVCRKCDKERGITYIDNSSPALQAASKGVHKFTDKVERAKIDNYWHRRWAGDALKTLLSGAFDADIAKPMLDIEKREGVSLFDQVAGASVKMADAMLNAYKEREENGT